MDSNIFLKKKHVVHSIPDGLPRPNIKITIRNLPVEAYKIARLFSTIKNQSKVQFLLHHLRMFVCSQSLHLSQALIACVQMPIVTNNK